MKYLNVIKRLGRFGFTVTKEHGSFVHSFYSRNEHLKNRLVKVHNQDGRAISIPMFVEPDGTETVVFHAKTIKQLELFLEGK